MCDCEKNLINQIVQEDNYKGRKILKVILPKMLFMRAGSRLCGILRLSVEGLKKEVDYKILFNYCPFCGEKFPEINQEKSNG